MFLVIDRFKYFYYFVYDYICVFFWSDGIIEIFNFNIRKGYFIDSSGDF